MRQHIQTIKLDMRRSMSSNNLVRIIWFYKSPYIKHAFSQSAAPTYMGFHLIQVLKWRLHRNVARIAGTAVEGVTLAY